jgi:hypothetical protein
MDPDLAQLRADLDALPGIAIGILALLAAVGLFSFNARWRLKRVVGFLVGGAIACLIIFGYLAPHLSQFLGGAS